MEGVENLIYSHQISCPKCGQVEIRTPNAKLNLYINLCPFCFHINPQPIWSETTDKLILEDEGYDSGQKYGRPRHKFDYSEVERLAAQWKSKLSLARALQINRNTLYRTMQIDERFREAVLNGRINNRIHSIIALPENNRTSSPEKSLPTPTVLKAPKTVPLTKKFLNWFEKINKRHAGKFSRLAPETQERTLKGITRHIRACRKLFNNISVSAINEIIADAEHGLFYFEQGETNVNS